MSKPFSVVWSPEFLRWLQERDGEPRTAAEADKAGPWRILPLPDGTLGLYRRGENPDRHAPAALFKSQEDALLAAAVFPAIGRDPLYRLLPDPTPSGFALVAAGEVVGHLPLFEPAVADGLHLLGSLLRSPAALAHLLEAASGPALEHAGKLLAE
jgi:hypothetical protein